MVARIKNWRAWIPSDLPSILSWFDANDSGTIVEATAPKLSPPLIPKL